MRVRCLFVAAVSAVALAAPAAAATPPTFFGMQVDGPVTDGTLDQRDQLQRMAQAGVGSVRFSLFWRDMQPYAGWSQVPAAQRARFTDVSGVPTDFSFSDKLLADASAADLRPLPVLERAPVWARRHSGDPASSPTAAGRRAYARLLSALVGRYGPGGTFWASNAYTTPAVVERWQIWNEPNGDFEWKEQPAWSAYAKLLKVSYRAVKSADPHAQVIAAGLFGYSWEWLAQLYKSGGRRYFDAAAVHPFTLQVRNVGTILKRFRSVMRKHGDGNKPLYVTELSWPAAKGKTSTQTGFETTPEGQARRLDQAYRLIIANRSRWRVSAVYWSTWVTRYASPSAPFDYSGLFKLDGDQLVAQKSFDALRAIIEAFSSG